MINTNNTTANNTDKMMEAVAEISILVSKIKNDPANSWVVDPEAKEAILDGRSVAIFVELYKPLRRWGKTLFMEIYGGEIIVNNLYNSTWNMNKTKAEIEAAQAARYFLDADHNLNDALFIRIAAE